MLLFLLLSSTVTGIDAARILMTSPQITSHIIMQLSVGSELVRSGHEVHVAVGSRFPKPEMVQKLGIGIIYYQYPLDVFHPISEEFERSMMQVVFDMKPDWLLYIQTIQKSIYDGCWYMMSDEAFLNRVKQMNFDIVMVEPFGMCPCTMILPHYLGLPFVSMTGSFFPWHMGIPALPSAFPLITPVYVGSYPELGTFIGRLKSAVAHLVRGLFVLPTYWSNTTLLHHYGNPDKVSSWLELMRQSQLFITDRDHHLEEFSPPLLPNFIAVRGLTADPPGPLSADLEKIFAESGDNGVILVTFGASASYTPVNVIEKFFDAFSRLPQTVVAKFVVPDGVYVPSNVKLLTWLPQNDILGHHKTRLFITHCGGNGQYESVYHGVPMLGFPLYAEQSWNAERAYRKGFGLKMDITDFTADELYDSIVKIIQENSTYRAAVKKMSAILQSHPTNGRQTAAFWIDHVIKFGGDHLRPFSIDQPLYQFVMLDVLIFFLLVIVVVFVGCALCILTVVRKCQRRSSSDQTGLSKKTR